MGYFARRVLAFVLDAALLFAGVLATQMLLWVAGLHPFRAPVEAGRWPGGWPLHLWVFVSTSLPFWVYYAALHSSPWQATLGKRVTGLKVSASTGGRLSFARALLRAIVMLIPFEVNHFVILRLAPANAAPSPEFFVGLSVVYALVALYLAVTLLDPHRRSPHDLASGSIVTAR